MTELLEETELDKKIQDVAAKLASWLEEHGEWFPNSTKNCEIAVKSFELRDEVKGLLSVLEGLMMEEFNSPFSGGWGITRYREGQPYEGLTSKHGDLLFIPLRIGPNGALFHGTSKSLELSTTKAVYFAEEDVFTIHGDIILFMLTVRPTSFLHGYSW